MAIGLFALGLILSVVPTVLMMRSMANDFAPSSSSGAQGMEIDPIIAKGGAGECGLGVVLFAEGFPMHGLRPGRKSGPVTDFEAVIEAQNEQLRGQDE